MGGECIDIGRGETRVGEERYVQVDGSTAYLVAVAAIDLNIPLLTNARLASAYIDAFTTHPIDEIEIKSWDEY